MKMYICTECEKIFNQPNTITERHGLTEPPYETIDVSPCCQSAFAETWECGYCGDYIAGDYIVVDDVKFCECCYQVKNVLN